ncbi:hypothetical protein GCM10025868_43560 [Angustibacter aerolatus]|uniref:Endonuclease/exonuclease/phosphatase domain-containing protein n=1 Tax=Angustibacter aerolatus TaxID=1162965 RepID=A0ABQ6JQZ8_9ACTN|nr:hypothetical protein GCM10025868_43560 [Angustibacter aerolatus]
MLHREAARLPVRGPFTRTRGVALALVEVGGARLTVLSVHLPLRPEERADHARRVVGRVTALPGAVVLAGDLNEPPDGPSWARLQALGRDAALDLPGAATPTYPSRSPHRRIDALLVSPQVRVLSLRSPGGPLVRSASDHQPLVAELEVTPG